MYVFIFTHSQFSEKEPRRLQFGNFQIKKKRTYLIDVKVAIIIHKIEHETYPERKKKAANNTVTESIQKSRSKMNDKHYEITFDSKQNVFAPRFSSKTSVLFMSMIKSNVQKNASLVALIYK